VTEHLLDRDDIGVVAIASQEPIEICWDMLRQRIAPRELSRPDRDDDAREPRAGDDETVGQTLERWGDRVRGSCTSGRLGGKRGDGDHEGEQQAAKAQQWQARHEVG